jgi:hypothetical protein
VIALLYIAMEATAQTNRISAPARSASVNQFDSKGKPHGMWVIGEPAAMGEPGFTQFGRYEHGDKVGPWYKLDGDGDLMAAETYRNNVLDGETKYYDKGRLIAVGMYRGLNPEREYDTIMVEDPVTGLQRLRAVHNERNTVRHGIWRFYNADNGRMIREEEYQVDSMIYSKEFGLSKDDSTYYLQREAKMPHNRKKSYSPPPGKDAGYIKY